MTESLKRFLVNAVAFTAMAMIAFQMYWQYWFVNLVGVWVVNPLVPLAMLGVLAVLFIWGSRRFPDHLRITTFGTWAFLALYLASSTVSILVNEPNLSGMIHWLVDVWSAAAVFLLILGLKNLRDNSTLNWVLKLLFVGAVLLSVYALAASYIHPPGTPLPPTLKWGDHAIIYFTGDDIRLTVPGLGSNHYPAMLLPLIFLGIYFASQSQRLIKSAFLLGTSVLMYCVFATRTRAALIPLVIGFAYLIFVRCIRGRAVLVSGLAIGALFLVNPAAVQRLTVLMPIFNAAGRQILWDIVRNPQSPPEIDHKWETQDHFILAADTIGLALTRPILGLGMSRLADFQNSTLGFFAGKSHNNFLSIAAGYGFPAMVFYLSFILSLTVYIWRITDRSKINSEVWRAAHTWMAILISYTLYLNGAPAEFHFIWLWFALAAVWLRNCFLHIVPEVLFREIEPETEPFP